MRYFMTFSYDGSDFQGYQKQPRQRTIQKELEDALKQINGGAAVSVCASGRTDAGVHALNQKAHFDMKIKITCDKLLKGLNSLLPEDIYVKKIPEGLDYIYVRPDSEYQLSCSMSLKTFHSTDRGVAFLLNTEEGQLYHAGDLNDWQLKDESKQYNHNMSARYQREIQKIKECRIDVAFLPLDPRQEEYYGKGMEYFLQNIPVRHVYPMHYWEHPEVIERFCREHPEYREIIRDTEHTVRQEVSIH